MDSRTCTPTSTSLELTPIADLEDLLRWAAAVRILAERRIRRRFDPELSLLLDRLVLTEEQLREWIEERQQQEAA